MERSNTNPNAGRLRGGDPAQRSFQEFDHISSLSDCVLISILSLLPIEEAARTSVLSSRWRRLWTLATLRLDEWSLRRPAAVAYKYHGDWLAGVVGSILAVHKGPIHTFRLHTFFGASLYQCVETVCGRGVADLELGGHTELEISKHASMQMREQLPEAILRCESLTVLKLTGFKVNERSVLEARGFINLKKVDFYDLNLTDKSLNTLLTACEVLEELCLRSCTGVENIEIRLPLLRKFVVVSRGKTRAVTIEDAPNLEKFLIDLNLTAYSPLIVRHAPKLSILGLLNFDTEGLDIYGSIFETPSSGGLECSVTSLSNLKHIGIKVNPAYSSQIRKVVNLLRCCPCLEKLDIEFEDRSLYNAPRRGKKFSWREEDSFDCLDNHLTQVRTCGFEGKTSHLNIAKFFILNAKVLKQMELFDYQPWRREKGWKTAMERQLRMKKKASPEAEINLFEIHYPLDHFDSWQF